MAEISEPDPLRLLDAGRQLTDVENRALSASCRTALAAYRAAVASGDPPRDLTARARRAYLHLGGDPERAIASLKDYDNNRWGPFLGVSDEGSAAGAIRDAAFESPKVRSLPNSVSRTPLVVGVAVDAERLGGIGEIMVGPEEYAEVWLACVDRLLVTTNIGTRVNTRVYRREPRVLLRGDGAETLEQAKAEIKAAFQPFVETPDREPRPLTVFVDIPRFVRMTAAKKRTALRKLAAFVASGKAAGKKAAPSGHSLGLAAWVGLGPKGRDASMEAIDLASSVGIEVVILDGVKRKVAAEAISLAGLLDYFPPGIVGPLLRKAKQKNVRLRAANLPDTDTIARSIWSGLATARSMGANLGKYGCFPLTRPEIDNVVELIQRWLPTWSAAPVFFVDQGLLREGAVDVDRDIPRGIEIWLETVAEHKVSVVLIDTIDKATGRRLLKKSSDDKKAFLSLKQIARIEKRARELGIKVLWAGGFGMRDAFEMGKLNAFGIYVTSAAATTIPVGGSYLSDPGLAGLKEPTKEAVLRTKIILEAGFLTSRLEGEVSSQIDQAAESLLLALDEGDKTRINRYTTALASACEAGWRLHWKAMPVSEPPTKAKPALIGIRHLSDTEMAFRNSGPVQS